MRGKDFYWNKTLSAPNQGIFTYREWCFPYMANAMLFNQPVYAQSQVMQMDLFRDACRFKIGTIRMGIFVLPVSIEDTPRDVPSITVVMDKEDSRGGPRN